MVALVGMLMVAPTINVGLVGDDHVQRVLLLGQVQHEPKATPFGLFTFADGSAEQVQALKASGRVSWPRAINWWRAASRC